MTRRPVAHCVFAVPSVLYRKPDSPETVPAVSASSFQQPGSSVGEVSGTTPAWLMPASSAARVFSRGVTSTTRVASTASCSSCDPSRKPFRSYSSRVESVLDCRASSAAANDSAVSTFTPCRPRISLTARAAVGPCVADGQGNRVTLRGKLREDRDHQGGGENRCSHRRAPVAPDPARRSGGQGRRGLRHRTRLRCRYRGPRSWGSHRVGRSVAGFKGLQGSIERRHGIVVGAPGGAVPVPDPVEGPGGLVEPPGFGNKNAGKFAGHFICGPARPGVQDAPVFGGADQRAETVHDGGAPVPRPAAAAALPR